MVDGLRWFLSTSCNAVTTLRWKAADVTGLSTGTDPLNRGLGFGAPDSCRGEPWVLGLGAAVEGTVESGGAALPNNLPLEAGLGANMPPPVAPPSSVEGCNLRDSDGMNGPLLWGRLEEDGGLFPVNVKTPDPPAKWGVLGECREGGA